MTSIINESKEKYLDIYSKTVSTLLCYPRFNYDIYAERLKELEWLKIDKIGISGKTIIRGINVLGKGHRSIVFKVKKKDSILALKVRRIDSSRKNNHDEVFFQKMANSINIGPKLIDYTDNFLLMEYIDGIKIKDYFCDPNFLNKSVTIEQNNKNKNKDDNYLDTRKIILDFKKILREILFQCYMLDSIHLDHGELSYIDNHVIVEKKDKVKIIDFESASVERKTINLSSVIHSLLLFGPISSSIREIVKLPEKNEIINLVKKYKQKPSRDSFDDIFIIIK